MLLQNDLKKENLTFVVITLTLLSINQRVIVHYIFKYRMYFNRRACLSVCVLSVCFTKNNRNRFGDYCLHSGTFYDLVVLVLSLSSSP